MKDYLNKYADTIYPFHMPGHKLGRLAPLVGQNLYKIDTTEVEGTDDLFQASGIIKGAQDCARTLYGTIETFLLINGSSCGILSAISACSRQESKILMARNSHKSVYNGVLLNRLEPIYLYPEYIKNYKLFGGIDAQQVEIALSRDPDISFVVITSPTYEGFTSDIKAISAITKKYDKLLIVDEAHGAHFNFSTYFPESAIECGADIVIHSLHKTLPAFTQSALLHVNTARVDIEKIKMYLEIYQTSSPSYLLMSGIDQCLSLLEEKGDELFHSYTKALSRFRDKIQSLEFIHLVDKEILKHTRIKDMDESKLLFVGKKAPINGKQIDRILREHFQIQVEMATRESFLALTSIADGEDAFELLYRALKVLDQAIKNKTLNLVLDTKDIKDFEVLTQPKKIYSPFQASQLEQETVPLLQAINKISGQFISIYPPGIPVIIPGEQISEEQIEQLVDYMDKGFNIKGIENNAIKVLK